MSSSLGGLSRILMSVAPKEATLIPTQLETEELNFIASQSSYSEVMETDGSVRHTLRIAVDGGLYGADEGIFSLNLDRGFVARVVLDWGREIVVGYSSLSGYDRALRLSGRSYGSGGSLLERPVVIWLFECVDSVMNI